MRVEVWEDSDGITAIRENNNQKHLLILADAKLLRIITAKTWYKCMKIHHKLMGWEPYKPFKEDDIKD